VVNQQTKEITYTPYYFMFEHFSSFVRPGAQRLHVTASGEGTLGEAFVNPDGQVVFVASNRTETEATIWLKINGQMFQAALPARSFNTFTIRPAP
jgi:glucosylceramidase